MTDQSWNDAFGSVGWDTGRAEGFIRNELSAYQSSHLFQLNAGEYENNRIGLKEFLGNAEALGYALDYLVLVNPATYRNDPRYAAIIAKAKGDGSNDGFASGLLAAVEGLSYSAMFGMNAVREPEIALDHLKAMWEDFTYSGADENLKIMQGNIYGAVYDFQSKTTATGVALGTAWGATRLMRDYARASTVPEAALSNTLPEGAIFKGSLYRIVGEGHDPLLVHPGNVAASHRYTGPGEGGLYFASGKHIAEAELVNNGVPLIGRQIHVFPDQTISGLLDLTNPVVRENIGISIGDLTRTGGAQVWRYEVTQSLGAWARQNGYQGIIVPSAQADGGVNLILFDAKGVK